MKKKSEVEEKSALFSSETTSSIKNWKEDDRPREKLLMKGKQALSDAELLAIIIGSGSKNESAVDLSKRILASAHHNWNELSAFSVEQLCQFKGIGAAKALSIVTAMEMGKRRLAESPQTKNRFTSPEFTYQYLQSFLSDLPHEEFWVLYLDQAHQEIKKIQISKGGITSTTVDVRLILKYALECQATSLILAHNHPSGNLQPSSSDKELTLHIQKAAQIMNITVLDHIIIGKNHFFSFSTEGLLSFK